MTDVFPVTLPSIFVICLLSLGHTYPDTYHRSFLTFPRFWSLTLSPVYNQYLLMVLLRLISYSFLIRFFTPTPTPTFYPDLLSPSYFVTPLTHISNE